VVPPHIVTEKPELLLKDGVAGDDLYSTKYNINSPLKSRLIIKKFY
jgi:hypothetical protein